MKKVTNLQIAKVFISAKKNLRSDCHYDNKKYLSPYICGAIALTGGHTAATRNAATSVIAKRLGRCSTVTSWLYHKGHITGKSFADYAEEAQQVQQFRHRWLDSLIEEFSK